MTDPQHPTNSSYSYTSLQYFCPTCQRQFNSLSLDNSQAHCPRCDTLSNPIPHQDTQDNDPNIQQTPPLQSSSDHQQDLNGRNGYLYFTETLLDPPSGRLLVRTLRIPVMMNPEESQPPTDADQNPHTTAPTHMDIEENPPPASSDHNENTEEDHGGSIFSRFLHRLLGTAPDIPVYVFLAEYTPLDERLIEEFLRNDPNHYGPPPAAEEDIKKLQEIKFDPFYLRQGESSMCCTICREDYQQGDSVVRLPCKHDYHKDCVNTWLTKHNSCPMCRQAI